MKVYRIDLEDKSIISDTYLGLIKLFIKIIGNNKTIWWKYKPNMIHYKPKENELVDIAYRYHTKNNKNNNQSNDFDYLKEITKPSNIKILLDGLTDDERYELLSNYCKYCGSHDNGCQCWNDD